MALPYNNVPGKPWKPVDSISLAHAVLCANCEQITHAENGHCPVCGSASLVNLGNLLNRGENEPK